MFIVRNTHQNIFKKHVLTFLKDSFQWHAYFKIESGFPKGDLTYPCLLMMLILSEGDYVMDACTCGGVVLRHFLLRPDFRQGLTEPAIPKGTHLLPPSSTGAIDVCCFAQHFQECRKFELRSLSLCASKLSYPLALALSPIFFPFTEHE